MITIDPQIVSIPELQSKMFGAIGPRPIAFASTIDKEGNPNLSPFSFFNAFGVNPPTLIFSPSRRGRDNSTKHTFENVKEVPEVVINVVTYDMVHQTSLASTEYDKGVDEFLKAGFSKIESKFIKPFRVKESPVQFECKVKQIIETSQKGGAGNLVICEILLMHVDEKVLDEKGNIDPHKIDLVGRLGGDFYCRASGDSVFEIEKPITRKGLGIDLLPEKIRNSKVLTGNDLGQLGNIEKLPSDNEIEEMSNEIEIQDLLSINPNQKNIHLFAQKMIEEGRVYDALKLLMM